VVRHTDRAITPGDAWLWLPDERIAVLGDLLINPITFALFCYPSAWIRTLEAIDAIDAAVLVPGHGAPMRDETLLKATMALRCASGRLPPPRSDGAIRRSGEDRGPG
jgi:glyoxylase-like metal-dependent hydrolase (beta-lactamase superfamily II)